MSAKDRQVSYLTSQGSEANPGLPVILRYKQLKITLLLKFIPLAAHYEHLITKKLFQGGGC